MKSEWPARTNCFFPVLVSQMAPVLSPDAVAKCLPSGLNDRRRTASVCPLRRRVGAGSDTVSEEKHAQYGNAVLHRPIIVRPTDLVKLRRERGREMNVAA